MRTRPARPIPLARGSVRRTPRHAQGRAGLPPLHIHRLAQSVTEPGPKRSRLTAAGLRPNRRSAGAVSAAVRGAPFSTTAAHTRPCCATGHAASSGAAAQRPGRRGSQPASESVGDRITDCVANAAANDGARTDARRPARSPHRAAAVRADSSPDAGGDRSDQRRRCTNGSRLGSGARTFGEAWGRLLPASPSARRSLPVPVPLADDAGQRHPLRRSRRRERGGCRPSGP